MKESRKNPVPTQPGRNGGTLLAGSHGKETGRPKGSRNRSTIAREFLETVMKARNPISGKDENLTIEQRMTLSIIGQVLSKGNVQAYNSILDNAYGKQKETLEVEGLNVTPYDILKQLESPRNSKTD